MLRRWVWLGVVLALAACAPRTSEAPTIQLQSPEGGVHVVLGDRVLVQSAAEDDEGVTKVELWVDGRLYEAKRVDETEAQTRLDTIHIWDAAALGEHALAVRAFDRDGQFSELDSVSVQVVTPPPTPTPSPTPETAPAIDPSCQPSARFVEDVTVPDDSLFNSGVRFVKTWRLRNDGECRWEPGTTWTFIQGELLDAQSPIEVELVDPGRLVEISLDMEAPPAPGTYTSYWRLQRPNGEFFGDQAYVRIIVP